ncbi:MAG: alkaline shock response membrane anchor protein AmaP [Opitutales bacterium]
MSCTDFANTFKYLVMPPYLYVGIAVIVLVLCYLCLRRRQPRSILAYTTEQGRLTVSRSAIVELVRSACEQLDHIARRPKVRIRLRGRSVDFEIRIKLAEGGKLKDVEQTLQRHLRRELTQNLGIENLGRIDVVAAGFKSGRVEPEFSGDAPADASEDDAAASGLADDADRRYNEGGESKS